QPGSILNADPNSYWDAFVFSFQTSTTIGYGHFIPATSYANSLVLIDTVTGIVFTAITTGLAFSKFSRPTAKVIFSNHCVVNRFHGKRTMKFRMANARDSHIADASLQVAVVMTEVSPEGDLMQRIFDLKLVRSHTPVFFMSWTAMHVIDQDSPLHNLTSDDMRERNVRIVISMTGIDDWTAQQVHSNYSYNFEHIAFNKKFVDILEREGDEVSMNYSRFHDIK
ncbi:MAG: ATP-sensitive inward rectifier potassium channel 10, partial [Bdellovibrionales bacterium]|nr:ion channel [Bdellovibrionales bacterium]NQZ19159.1 ATP-sensitive inward rectifier potassium channel 10 [Bdellovibrionales bacterium]